MHDKLLNIYDSITHPITLSTTVEEWLENTDKRIVNALNDYGLTVNFNHSPDHRLFMFNPINKLITIPVGTLLEHFYRFQIEWYVVHELCHYIVATPTQRATWNFDLPDMNDEDTLFVECMVRALQERFYKKFFDQSSVIDETASKSVRVYDTKHGFVQFYFLDTLNISDATNEQKTHTLFIYKFLQQLGLINHNNEFVYNKLNLSEF